MMERNGVWELGKSIQVEHDEDDDDDDTKL